MELDFIEQGISADPHDGSLSIILAELERIDFLIQLQVWRARNLNLLDENFQGLYIAEEEIDALLGEPAGLPRWVTDMCRSRASSYDGRFSCPVYFRKEQAI